MPTSPRNGRGGQCPPYGRRQSRSLVELLNPDVAILDRDAVVLEIHPAVAASLARLVGHVRRAELDVQLDMPVEGLLGDDVAPLDLHRVAVDELPGRRGRRLRLRLGPAVERLAVEEDDRAPG